MTQVISIDAIDSISEAEWLEFIELFYYLLFTDDDIQISDSDSPSMADQRTDSQQ